MQPLEFTGKYSSCKVFCHDIEESAMTQIYDFLNCPASEGMNIRFMPDIHAGAGCVIGFTGTLTDKIIPNLIGVDIGCGVASMRVSDQGYVVDNTDLNVVFQKLDQHIRSKIPSGCRVREAQWITDPRLQNDIEEVCKATGQNSDYVLKSLGTLGGGNHFIEVGQDEHGGIWATVHSGSRNFGLKIAKFHQALAVPTVGRGRGLEWLEGEAALLYHKHMDVAQRFAVANRRIMLKIIADFFGIDTTMTQFVESIHNYIDFKDKVVRKGAIAARQGEMVIIPWNMRDGMIIGWGKGNPEWNCSAPHGAGRICGRKEAKRRFKVEEFKESMDGIWTSCVGESTLDEAPFVYKDHKVIKEAISETVDILFNIKPLYNFKAAE